MSESTDVKVGEGTCWRNGCWTTSLYETEECARATAIPKWCLLRLPTWRRAGSPTLSCCNGRRAFWIWQRTTSCSSSSWYQLFWKPTKWSKRAIPECKMHTVSGEYNVCSDRSPKFSCTYTHAWSFSDLVGWSIKHWPHILLEAVFQNEKLRDTIWKGVWPVYSQSHDQKQILPSGYGDNSDTPGNK